MSESQKKNGHLAAIFTIILWGTTYISTKVLLVSFHPIEILIIRFLVGYAALCIACPHPAKRGPLRMELTFFGAGASGIACYYLLEHFSLLYTQASNTGVIISTAPFFTGMLLLILKKRATPLGRNFYIGFLVAMAGICALSFGGTGASIHIFGDLLALLASFSWALYSVFSRQLTRAGYPTLQMTRRIFFYGILLLIPAAFVFRFSPDVSAILMPVNLANLLYLSIGASALCFVTWNYAVKVIGAVRTSVYIYLTPVVTVLSSVLILHEVITPAAFVGILLTLSGLFISERRSG